MLRRKGAEPIGQRRTGWRTGNDQGLLLLLPYFIGEERSDEAKPAANRCTSKYANRTEQLEEEEGEGEEDCADWEACG